jgi:UDP-glucose 4-epimerase
VCPEVVAEVVFRVETSNEKSRSQSGVKREMDNLKRVLVTGGSGYIGSVVVRELLDRGCSVVVFDNLERGHRCNIDARADFIEGDLRDAETTKRAVVGAKPDAVLHFAAYALVGESMGDPLLYFRNNVGGGVNLLAAMEAAGCDRIVFSSSCATYGIPPALPIEETMDQRPTNPYGHSKLMFEQMCNWLAETKGLRPTFLRYFNAAGAVPELGLGEDHDPETHIIPNVLKVALGQKACVEIFGEDYPTPDGTCIRDYVHLKDLSSAHVLALEKEALGAYNLGTGNGVSVKQIVEACRKATGHPIPVKISPRRPGDPPALYASGEKARRVMGWRPAFSDIETIVADAWAFHKAHPNGVGR